MGRRFGAAGGFALAWACLAGPAAWGQSPASGDYDLSFLSTPPTPVAAAVDGGGSGPWGTDFLLGLPTGFRLQRSLDADTASGPLVEGFAGLFVILPALGGGVRWRCEPIGRPNDALVLSPGVDAYLLVNPVSAIFDSNEAVIPMVSADVDCNWSHHFGERYDGEFGLKLGAGLAFARGSTVVPIVAVYAGLRF